MDIFFWLWLADVSSRLAFTLTLSGIFMGVGLFFFPMLADIVDVEVDVPKWTKRAMWAIAACFLVASLLPSKTTIYIGLTATKTEQVLSHASANPTIQKALRLLDQRLDEALTTEDKK